jgi:aminomethyltransferase
MALSWRYSALADRHRALGSKLEDWNGMGTAWTYAKDVARITSPSAPRRA